MRDPPPGVADRRGPRPAGAALLPEGAEATGLALDALPDGSLRATLQQLVLRGLRLQAGAATLEVEQLTLHDATLILATPGPGGAIELLGLSAREIALQGLQAELTGAVHAPPLPAGPWRLDAVGGMEGQLHLFVTDAAWIIDADVRLPVSGGRLDFNRVLVEHIGPNSSMGISPAGVYIDAPHAGRNFLYLFTDGRVPGARFEQRATRHASRVADRGALDLQAFLQGLLDPSRAGGLGRPADRHAEARLDRTRLQGELRLGDGALGTERLHAVLDGRAEGRNRIELSAAVLGHRLLLRMPALSASRTAFELHGKAVTTGPVCARLKVEVTRPRTSTCRPRVLLQAAEVRVQRVAMGGADGA